jgi:hypothetical protein
VKQHKSADPILSVTPSPAPDAFAGFVSEGGSASVQSVDEHALGYFDSESLVRARADLLVIRQVSETSDTSEPEGLDESIGFFDSETPIPAPAKRPAGIATGRTSNIAVAGGLLLICVGFVTLRDSSSTAVPDAPSTIAEPSSTGGGAAAAESTPLRNRTPVDPAAGSLAVASTSGTSDAVRYRPSPPPVEQTVAVSKTTVPASVRAPAIDSAVAAASNTATTGVRQLDEPRREIPVTNGNFATPDLIAAAVAASEVTRNEPVAKVAVSPTAIAPTETAFIGTPSPAASAPIVTIPDPANVQRVVNQYARAFAALDAAQVKAVWPSADERAVRRAFDGLRSQDVAVESCDITINAPNAVATCDVATSYVPKVGSKNARRERRQWVFYLVEDNEQWAIQEIRLR